VFGRSNQDQPPPPIGTPANQSSPQPSPADPAAYMSTSPPSTASTVSVIGEDVAIVGQKITVISQSSVQVNGCIEGDINGQEVIVGPSGKVTGTVTANLIKIEGEIQGALKGASVSLMPTARVDGDIFHQKLAISEGAQFDGRVRRPQDATEVTPNLDPASLQGSARQE